MARARYRAAGLFVGLLAIALPAVATTVDTVRLWRAPDSTRIVFDLSAAANYKAVVRKNPDALVIDIAGASLRYDLGRVAIGKTPVRAIRGAMQGGRDLRITLELAPGINFRVFSLGPNDQYGNRLVVDLIDQGKPAAQIGAAPVRLPQSASMPSVPVSGRAIVIAVDAGHGGADPGATGPNGIHEKAVVLAISRQLKKLVDAEPGFRAVLVRDGDYFIPLRQRSAIAREKRADMFVSVHADAFRNVRARGASVYALSRGGATSETASYLARRENRSDLIGGVGGVSLRGRDPMVASVLLDLSMTATLATSLEVGDRVLKSMGGLTRLHRNRVEQAGFVVLKSPDIPSILVETGFISNPEESKRLSDPAYQRKLASAIFYGVKRHFHAQPPVGTLLAANTARRALGAHVKDVYVIGRGDTLSGIAAQHRVSMEALMQHNGMNNTSVLVGQALKIPPSS